MNSHPSATAFSLASQRQSASHSLNLAHGSARNSARGNPAMKTMFAISAAAALLAGAGAAAAQDAGPAVELLANAPEMCTLPDTLAFHSSTGGAGSVVGNTWTVSPSLFANANGTAASGGEVAIRLRGEGFCNVSHQITVTSERGGLASDETQEQDYVLPAGFADRRAIRYEAYWVASGTSSSTVPLGPKANLLASPGNLTTTANYTVSGLLPPPGNRAFDLRIGMARPAIAAPLLAGDYADTVTVTLSPQP